MVDGYKAAEEQKVYLFRTPGQKREETQIDGWVKIEKGNRERQGEAGGKASLKGSWWT